MKQIKFMMGTESVSKDVVRGVNHRDETYTVGGMLLSQPLQACTLWAGNIPSKERREMPHAGGGLIKLLRECGSVDEVHEN